MATITNDRAHPVSPPGYEVNDTCHLTEDVAAGDLLQYEGTMSGGQPKMKKCPAGATPHGIALKDGYQGQRGFDVGIQGEMDGFAGLTPGADLYASGSTAGAIDDAAGGGSNPDIPARAVRETRIRYSFV